MHEVITPLVKPSLLAAEEAWLKQLRQAVEERVAAERNWQERTAVIRREEQQAHRQAEKQLTTTYDTTIQDAYEQQQTLYLQAANYWVEQLEELESVTAAAIEEIEDRYNNERRAAQSSRDETTWLVGSLLDEQSSDSPRQQLARLHAQIDGTEAVLQDAVREAEDIRVQAAEYLDYCRLSTEVGISEPAPPPTSLTALQQRCQEEVQRVQQPYRQLRRLWLPRLFSGFRPFFAWLLLAALMAAPTWWFLDPSAIHMADSRHDQGWMAIVIGSSAAISMVSLLMLHLAANQRAFVLITEIFAHSRAAQALFARWQRLAAEELATSQHELDRRHGRRKQQRDTAIEQAESEFAERTQQLDEWRRDEIERLRMVSITRRQQLEQSRDAQLHQLAVSGESSLLHLQQQRQEHIQMLGAAHAEHTREIESELARTAVDFRQRWLSTLDELSRQSTDWRTEADRLCLPWSTLPGTTADGSSRNVVLGKFQISLSALRDGLPERPELQPPVTEWQLPAMIDLQDRPALLVQYRDPASRTAATELLQATMLRLLAVLPPGQVRFTILDPISLGENFATFMHLADVDELLINRRIWTEPGHIEERLEELTDHMQTVLQMFLRNEFASLDEYNEQAGEVAEPYRVLVVAGLPHGCSEIALRRLWNIVTSGARCGVISLISVDLAANIPGKFSLDDLQPYAQTLTWNRDGFRWQNPELQQWPLVTESLPSPEEFGRLVKQFGQQAGDVRKVEVPFQRVAPRDNVLWTHSAASRLEIPIGRAGATRTQSVVLGTGTSQHVLIAGKTGSGKSSLLHAMITNAALHYSPDELELYLVDFKKGVEFKVYARSRLPHARVVGIESDREFGVSVLERLDRELQERSAEFRDAGVADLAGFRRARPGQRMPRLMLIIDEFQEFFVDDDSLAQTASLLLDRLIRQGRAFGVHVVLGSQTLAGAYSLARSTLGQVAVRIALQCSETDAHLILSEENTAARLLTRPGEAIYNDANGLTSGNHLFQVVWLDDAVREQYLQQLASLNQERSLTQSSAIIFEGNVPANLRQLPWRTASTGKGQGVTAWLGEAVSLRGPMGLEFLPSSGHHLMVVGQDEVSAAGILTAAAVSVATAQTDTRLLVFNGSPSEATLAGWQDAAAELPAIELRDFNELEATLKELVEEVRLRDGRPGPRRWLCLFDLVRFRKLRRKDDDFGFGGFDKKDASPSDLLAEILRDGPTVGLHVWLWCDSTNTVSRWLSREMQQQLENRVALAMNANDSSQLIDSPVASRLGANRAWLYRGERGTLEKFRPYSPPRPGDVNALLATERTSS